LFARAFSERESRAVGAARVKVSSLDNPRLSSLRREVSRMRAGYVVYVPVEASEGMAMIRFESLGKGRVTEDLAVQTKISASDFKEYLLAGAQPESKAIRERLQRELMPPNDRDSGKIVLFKDLAFYGISPAALGRGDVVVSSSLPRAAANLKWLETATQVDGNYVGIFGYPRTEAEYKNVFGDQTNFGRLEEWQQHRAGAEEISQKYGLKIIEPSGADAAAAKTKVLAELEKADGIVFVVAHAKGCTISLPSGEKVSITPGDIGALRLRNNPFVILRICQDTDHGFADAFVKAGARGVWLNRGIVGADVANRQIGAFLELIRAGQTIGAAVRKVRSTDPHAGAATLINVEKEENNGSRGAGHSESLVGVKR
jgi:hypothetical protein